MHHHPLLNWLHPRRDEMLEALKPLVEHESPSRDKPALDTLAQTLEARFTTLGATVEILDNPRGGNHVLARFRGADNTARPLLLVGHFDTVWPVGTLARMPFRLENDHAHGPGIFDMKASIVLIEYATKAIQAQNLSLPRPVVVLLTSDEEIGSPTSRILIEQLAGQSACALVLESPLPGGILKTARKGVGSFQLAVTGRAAHAGIEPEKGASAIIELAHQILKINSLADPEAGTTINIGTIEGGSTSNVVPATAKAIIDVRAWTTAEAARVEQALLSLTPSTPGTSLAVTGAFNRPPMERTPATAQLFNQAKAIAATLGLDLAEGSTGGGSDANFTAAAGLPTLDGLGTEGRRPRRPRTHPAKLPPRASRPPRRSTPPPHMSHRTRCRSTTLNNYADPASPSPETSSTQSLYRPTQRASRSRQ